METREPYITGGKKMRELRFDLVIKNKHTGYIHHKKYALCELMIGIDKLFDIENYITVAKRQYTGLKDKNGKEIYEGDILVNKEYKSSTCKYSVIWKQSICGFIGNGNEGDKYGYFTLNMSTNSGADEKKFKEYVEIIGNIYENPELLK